MYTMAVMIWLHFMRPVAIMQKFNGVLKAFIIPLQIVNIQNIEEYSGTVFNHKNKIVSILKNNGSDTITSRRKDSLLEP